MKLLIRSNATVQEIQEDFKQLFSHLKLEFYKNSHKNVEGSSIMEQLLHSVKFSEIYGSAADIEIEFNPEISTIDFENMFENRYHIHVQLFRFQRGTWLQTTHSDSLSLVVQNEMGVQSDINIKPLSATDIDLV